MNIYQKQCQAYPANCIVFVKNDHQLCYLHTKKFLKKVMNNKDLFPHEKDYLHSKFFHSKDLKTFIEKAKSKNKDNDYIKVAKNIIKNMR